ncbi:MAG: LacI family transcriptional regulator [Cycloclasticus sp.]|nr:LacI family transcriptional regulator [Cycloclasticus sp.]
MTTIYDIAKSAGVSAATVSRVINSRYGINTQTQKKVRKIMDDLNFRPRSKAMDLKRVMVMFPASEVAVRGMYFSQILAGITLGCFEQNWCPVHTPTRQHLSTASDFLHLLRQEGALGVIYLSHQAGYELPNCLELADVPHAVLGHTLDNQTLHTILPDDEASALQATNYLLGQGHRRIAFVSSSLDELGHAARYAGYRQAMAGHDDAYELSPVVCPWASTQSGHEAAAMLLAMPQRPTAVVVTNEQLAIGLSDAMQKKGLNLPLDLSIFSYESSDALAYTSPPMHSMKTPAFEMGKQAIALLNDQVESNKVLSPQHRVLPHHVQVRESIALD